MPLYFDRRVLLARGLGAEGLPKDATDNLVNALQVALKDTKVIDRFANLGTEPVPAEQATPAALKAHLAAEVPRWGEVIKAAGAKGE
jgi:tripartite-type tricarboxylate transporter receptor subunit TctC